MKKLILLTFIGITAFAAVYPTQKKSKLEQRLKVAVTIFPLYDLVKNIAKERLDVVLVVKPGVSPHTFSLTPEEIKKISTARLLFTIGHGVDDWAKNLSQDIKKVVVDKNITLLDKDPHYWLSVKAAKEISKTISEELGSLDPKNALFYQKNASKYQGRLDELDKEIKEKLSRLPLRKIATFHQSFVYFAKDYNLEIVATFEPSPGKQPTPQYLAGFQEKIRKNNIKVIFSEPQLSASVLKPIASDLGVKILLLDPLGGEKGRESFIELLRFNTNQIAKALK